MSKISFTLKEVIKLANAANISDKSKKQARKLLLMGGLGFHLFYVGRIGAGILRFLFGLGAWAIMLCSIFSPDTLGVGAFPMVPICLIMMVIFNIWDLLKISVGKFQDNIGNYLR